MNIGFKSLNQNILAGLNTRHRLDMSSVGYLVSSCIFRYRIYRLCI